MNAGFSKREMSYELRMQLQAEMSPESVRDRVLSPRRYCAPISKLGDARACMSQPRNNEKMFNYFKVNVFLLALVEIFTFG